MDPQDEGELEGWNLTKLALPLWSSTTGPAAATATKQTTNTTLITTEFILHSFEPNVTAANFPTNLDFVQSWCMTVVANGMRDPGKRKFLYDQQKSYRKCVVWTSWVRELGLPRRLYLVGWERSQAQVSTTRLVVCNREIRILSRIQRQWNFSINNICGICVKKSSESRYVGRYVPEDFCASEGASSKCISHFSIFARKRNYILVWQSKSACKIWLRLCFIAQIKIWRFGAAPFCILRPSASLFFTYLLNNV